MASEQAMALYRKLNSSGTAITRNNWREWERLASSAMKMPDFTPAGQSESLHDLANEVGIEIQALKSRASRPGAKDMMAKFNEGDRVVVPYGREMVRGKIVRYDAPGMFYVVDIGKYESIKVAQEDVRKASFARPGAKARFKVEDRFYFGKGRKERFADDAKQIADTILKQLGGGRFIAMTGAKNLAFMSNPPGLHMSLGRGTKDGIKYLRVNYDRGSDTYTMIFANKSGGTVKSVSDVYADSLQRVFTSTTGFDTHL